jgi:glycosyltransferase involved in cell wall biosynthesis
MTKATLSRAAEVEPADVCIIVEGCYPFIAGGVSAWIDWLLRSQPSTRFRVLALWPRPTRQPPRYQLPDNVTGLELLYLQDFGARPTTRREVPPGIDALAVALAAFMSEGGLARLAEVSRRLAGVRRQVPLDVLFNSPVAWEIVQRNYAASMPYGSFLHFFWAWRALFGGLFATLEHPLPPARVYHTISTGYAGVLAARAALETGRPALMTEHGIYTNERRIELLMADWVADSVDKGHALDDPRFDLRDMWVRAFEAYARTCYEACTAVVTLFADNQHAQRALGALPERSSVIANGIDLARFAGIGRASDEARPTMALIGRVVPIKDVKSFIVAAKILSDRVAGLRALIVGPTDEDPDYVAECAALVGELGIGHVVAFTGAVDVPEYLPQIHVAVLTSLSESQPLVLLEAGAAGIPFVATNVGSCREIIEGAPDETPPLGPGGIVTGLVAPAETAAAVGRLLADQALRRRCGEALRQRVARYYTSERATRAYAELYQRLLQRPTESRDAAASFDEG